MDKTKYVTLFWELVCPACGSDWTRPDAILVTYTTNAGRHLGESYERVYPHRVGRGWLTDSCGLTEAGKNAGCVCNACGESTADVETTATWTGNDEAKWSTIDRELRTRSEAN